jgi:hypothetical protein
MSTQSQCTLLAHELAHYRRGDHWVRLFELFVTGLFWWHPVVWWARREIEAAEEQCCDAWVVGQFPRAPRQYAEALLDTVDFLSSAHDALLAPAASGIGDAPLLRKRLTMIMHGVAPKSVSFRTRVSLLIVATVLLPLRPPTLASQTYRVAARVPFPATAEDAASVAAISGVGVAADAAAPLGKMRVAWLRSLTLEPITSHSWAAATSPCGRFVIAAGHGYRVQLLDVVSGRAVDLGVGRISSVAFSPGGRQFAAGRLDGAVELRDSRTGALERTLFVGDEAIRTVAFSPTGTCVAAGGLAGQLYLFDMANPAQVLAFNTSVSAIGCLRFSPDGRYLALSQSRLDRGQAGRGELWDLYKRQATS